ncbi:50S ribosomal protein L25 [Kiritimatiella glycovorans]|uniref:Large ribosomal subunit protein bL25 n=1 Tax=Kiritimatiella glycovorans TaxID=1307763 RepID=A0A0G3EDA5_9BACT|nr:50S ribosomal protein L25 [Kiritimatiella glycovorans]AKJ64436.1 50S ribosomal protein L25 [Kiritimatiella glycovorans]
MTEEILLQAVTRTETGTRPCRRMRRSGQLPAVCYRESGESQSLALQERAVQRMLRSHASENMVLQLSIDESGPIQAFLKDVQHEPLGEGLVHVDLQEISANQKLRVAIPVHLTGEPAGAVEGGVLEHLHGQIEVECLPADIVDMFEVDVSALNIGDSLSIADVPMDKSKYDLLDDPEIAIAHVSAPRTEEEEMAEEEEALEGEEGEAGEEGAEGEAGEGEEPSEG